MYCALNQPEKALVILTDRRPSSIKAYGMLLHHYAQTEQMDKVNHVFHLAIQHGHVPNQALFNMVARAMPDPTLLRIWFGDQAYEALATKPITTIESIEHALDELVRGNAQIHPLKAAGSPEMRHYLDTAALAYHQDGRHLLVPEAQVREYIERRKEEIVSSRLRFSLLMRYSTIAMALGVLVSYT